MSEDDTHQNFLTGGPGGAMAPLIWRRDQRKSPILGEKSFFLRKMNTTIEI